MTCEPHPSIAGMSDDDREALDLALGKIGLIGQLSPCQDLQKRPSRTQVGVIGDSALVYGKQIAGATGRAPDDGGVPSRTGDGDTEGQPCVPAQGASDVMNACTLWGRPHPSCAAAVCRSQYVPQDGGMNEVDVNLLVLALEVLAECNANLVARAGGYAVEGERELRVGASCHRQRPDDYKPHDALAHTRNSSPGLRELLLSREGIGAAGSGDAAGRSTRRDRGRARRDPAEQVNQPRQRQDRRARRGGRLASAAGVRGIGARHPSPEGQLMSLSRCARSRRVAGALARTHPLHALPSAVAPAALARCSGPFALEAHV